MKSVCPLCNTANELLRSHIIPEFLYRPLYDEKHRFSIMTAGVDNKRYGQRGLTERLLCHVCEQRLCRHEKYAAEVMSGRRDHRYKRRGDKITIEGIDYAPFKLFLMSVLWRASVSTLEFFKLVSLGPREELLRQMLLAEDPGKPEEFGYVTAQLFVGKNNTTGAGSVASCFGPGTVTVEQVKNFSFNTPIGF